MLLAVEGIEMNPGPKSKGGNSTTPIVGPVTGGPGRGSTSQDTVNHVPNVQNRSAMPVNPNVSAQADNRQTVREQPTINDWLNPSQDKTQTVKYPTQVNQDTGDTTQPDDEQSDSDGFETSDELDMNPAENYNIPISILLDIQKSVKRLDKKFDKMEKSIKGLKKENGELKAQNTELKENVTILQDTVCDLSEQNRILTDKYESLENQSRRGNLKFYNLTENNGETWVDTEQKVRQYIHNDLKLDASQISIERAHRLPGKYKPRPVIVKFSFYKDRERVLRTYREIVKANRFIDQQASEQQQNRTIRVGEDFSERVRKQRALLYPFMKEAID